MIYLKIKLGHLTNDKKIVLVIAAHQMMKLLVVLEHC